MTTPPPRKRASASKSTPAKKASPAKKSVSKSAPAKKSAAKKATPTRKVAAKKAVPGAKATPAGKAPTPSSEPILSPDGTQQWDGSAWVPVPGATVPLAESPMPPPAPVAGPSILPPVAAATDNPSGRDRRAQARADKAAAKAQRNWFLRHKILTAIGVLVLIGIIGGIASSGGSKSASPSTQSSGAAPAPASTSRASASAPASDSIAHAEDIKITNCGNGDIGGPSATVVVTNHSSKPSNYLVEISFESKDGTTQYGTGNAVVNSLNPGQSSAPQTADSLSTTPAPAGFTCRLSQLTRFAA